MRQLDEGTNAVVKHHLTAVVSGKKLRSICCPVRLEALVTLTDLYLNSSHTHPWGTPFLYRSKFNLCYNPVRNTIDLCCLLIMILIKIDMIFQKLVILHIVMCALLCALLKCCWYHEIIGHTFEEMYHDFQFVNMCIHFPVLLCLSTVGIVYKYSMLPSNG